MYLIAIYRNSDILRQKPADRCVRQWRVLVGKRYKRSQEEEIFTNFLVDGRVYDIFYEIITIWCISSTAFFVWTIQIVSHFFRSKYKGIELFVRVFVKYDTDWKGRLQMIFMCICQIWLHFSTLLKLLETC